MTTTTLEKLNVLILGVKVFAMLLLSKAISLALPEPVWPGARWAIFACLIALVMPFLRAGSNPNDQ